MVCQQEKVHGIKKFTEPSSLDVQERRWGSLATDFVVGLPKAKNGRLHYDIGGSLIAKISLHSV